jgi:hypothetical protein
MEDAERFRFPGEYRTPRFRIGKRVRCLLRGEMVITGMTDAPIPWPLGIHGAARHMLIVFKDLAKAIRREFGKAICHWWGVESSTVRMRRRALGVGIVNEGTSRLYREHNKESWAITARAKTQNKVRVPERCRKISETLRGRSMLPHVMEAALQARLGSHRTEEARRRMSETHPRPGTLVPGIVPWTAEEDELARTLPAKEAARQTGRNLSVCTGGGAS